MSVLQCNSPAFRYASASQLPAQLFSIGTESSKFSDCLEKGLRTERFFPFLLVSFGPLDDLPELQFAARDGGAQLQDVAEFGLMPKSYRIKFAAPLVPSLRLVEVTSL
jgi:hypothetical protein